MIGIDTNILLRLFMPEDDSRQTKAARKVVADEAPVFISPIVLVEFAWTLRRTFKLEREAVCQRLAGIIDAPEFLFAHPQAVRRAVEQYARGPADFADYLLGELNEAFGCEATLTFDLDAARSHAFRHLKV
jgi:predicted nucleic-acid-binding protein